MSRWFARHDQSSAYRRVGPMIEACFRPESDGPAGGAVTSSETEKASAHRAFRKMTARMMEVHNRRDPLEWIVLAFVTVMVAWPLLDLLIVLAQTANG
jgi:hypothetical protein